jgi:hypothetical protein
MNRSVWIGFDPREGEAFAVARASLHRHANVPIPVRGIVLDDLRARGLYTRPTEIRYNDAGQKHLYDVISEFPMATEFAVSRFLVPHLAKEMFQVVQRPDHGLRAGWALFADSDVLVRHSIDRLFAQADKRFAVMCVKHDFRPDATTKMDGQVQSKYNRKNWSSVMLFNCDHPANAALTPGLVNELPGRDLHRFCWLDDGEIGELDASWNFLVGHHNLEQVPNPSIVHFTDGIPTMKGYEDCDFAEEWRWELANWALK